MSNSLLWCQIIESEYNSLVNTLELLVNVPQLALRTLKSYIKRFEAVILSIVEGRLDVIEDLLNQMWNLIINSVPFDRFDTKNICQLAYSCLILREHFFNPNDTTGASDKSYVQFIPLDIRNGLRNITDTSTYENFDKYVCKLGFRKTLRTFVNTILAQIQTQLDELLVMMGINRIDEWINEYRTKSLVFLRKLQELDKFAQCAFGICNFAQTAINKRLDISERLLFEKQASGWSVKIDDFILGVQNKEDRLRQRIDELRTRLENPKFGSQGVKLTDIMKF